MVIVLKRSCPAVSQICSLTRFPSRSTVRILKSILRACHVAAQRFTSRGARARGGNRMAMNPGALWLIEGATGTILTLLSR